MIHSATPPQTEITSDQANLNTILALACEWPEKVIQAGSQANDFGLPHATQLPGGGKLW